MEYGQGSVWQRADGKWRAKLPGRKGASLGVFDTEPDAKNALAAVRAERQSHGTSNANTFSDFGRRVLDLREQDGVRGIRQERQRFRTHLQPSRISDLPVPSIQTGDIADLARALKGKGCSHALIQRCISLTSSIFTEAIVQRKRPDNPCKGIKLRRPAEIDPDTDEPWDYFRPEEMQKVKACEAIPKYARLLMAFAWASGLRQGEQWNLQLTDLHVDGPKPYVMVRYGSKGKKPKNGKVRRVPLTREGLEAAAAWLAYRDQWLEPARKRAEKAGQKLPHPELVFPTVTGCRRPEGAPSRTERVEEMTARGGKKRSKVELLPEWLKLAGVTRHLRWHDLRHTCGTWLLNGWWGRRWQLTEVRDMLGHSDLSVTQKYAHVDHSSLDAAASQTGAQSTPQVHQEALELDPALVELVRKIAPLIAVGRAGIEPATYGLKGSSDPQGSPGVTPQLADIWRTFRLFEALSKISGQ